MGTHKIVEFKDGRKLKIRSGQEESFKNMDGFKCFLSFQTKREEDEELAKAKAKQKAKAKKESDTKDYTKMKNELNELIKDNGVLKSELRKEKELRAKEEKAHIKTKEEKAVNTTK